MWCTLKNAILIGTIMVNHDKPVYVGVSYVQKKTHGHFGMIYTNHGASSVSSVRLFEFQPEMFDQNSPTKSHMTCSENELPVEHKIHKIQIPGVGFLFFGFQR